MSTASFLWRMIRYRPLLYTADDLVWLGIYLSRLLPGLVAQQAFDALQRGGAEPPAILWLAALFVGAGAVQAGLNVVGFVVDTVFRFSVSAVLQRNMLAELLRRPGARALDRTPGEALSVLRDDVEHAENGVDWTIDMFGHLVFALIAIAILVRVDATIALLVFVPLVAIVAVAQVATTRLRSSRQASQQATSRVTGALAEMFAAVQAVQIARAETAVVDHFRRLSEDRRRALLRERGFALFTESIYWNTVHLGTGLILLLGARAMQAGTFTVGDFALFVSYLGFVTEFTGFAGRFLTQYKQLDVSVARMRALIAGGTRDVPAAALVTPSPLYLRGPLPAVGVRPARGAEPLRALGVDRLTFRYPTGSSRGGGRGIADVSFALAGGSFTVVTGRIGAGKTTLLRVLLGLLPRDAGDVAWNGAVVDDPASFFVPPRCAYVAQVPRLFSDTVRGNILLGLDDEGRSLDRAVRAAVLERDVDQLDRGLDTLVGSRGVLLSGGQLQRVAAARALIRAPQLLVVDDLSSALDLDTEAVLWDRLLDVERGQRTILAVSHRRPVLRRADRIVVMKDGGVDSTGALEDLLLSSEEMRGLWEEEAATAGGQRG